jgi:hypothetical protein
MLKHVALLACLVPAVPCAAADAKFAPLPAAEVRSRVEAWITGRTTDAAVRTAALQAWPEAATNLPPERLLVAALASAGHVDAELARLVRDLEQGDLSRLAGVAEYLARPQTDPFFATNLRSLAGRRAAERRWYDEALVLLKEVDLQLAIDPAGVLFFRAVSAQGVLQIDLALDSVDQLLNQTERVPVRYSTTATLMQEELGRLKEKSLGEIARLMSDSERRLDLGRAGEQVQGVQERIVSGLDELIKKLEAQQSGGGGGAGNSSQSNESSGPANDSSVKGATAPGETDKQKFSKEGTWGDLPPKQQAEAKNLINRNFPSHYRQAIETYFKKLAGRPAAAPGK